jgi:hypothetical protein
MCILKILPCVSEVVTAHPAASCVKPAQSAYTLSARKGLHTRPALTRRSANEDVQQRGQEVNQVHDVTPNVAVGGLIGRLKRAQSQARAQRVSGTVAAVPPGAVAAQLLASIPQSEPHLSLHPVLTCSCAPQFMSQNSSTAELQQSGADTDVYTDDTNSRDQGMLMQENSETYEATGCIGTTVASDADSDASGGGSAEAVAEGVAAVQYDKRSVVGGSVRTHTAGARSGGVGSSEEDTAAIDAAGCSKQQQHGEQKGDGCTPAGHLHVGDDDATPAAFQNDQVSKCMYICFCILVFARVPSRLQAGVGVQD